MKQILKDSHGKTIGQIEQSGSKQKLYDSHGKYLGEYDGRNTKDSHGHTIGTGNLLTMLLK